MVCILSAFQAPLQAKLRPAIWLPGVRNLHSYEESAMQEKLIQPVANYHSNEDGKFVTATHMLIINHLRWEITELMPEVCVQKVVEAVARLAENEKIYLHKVDRERSTIQIFSYTKAEWLDVVEIEFYPGQFFGTEAKARSFSSGFLPVWVPLSFVFNVIFFFVPFYDNHFNQERLTRIREAMHLT